jgi:sulfur-carrier protein
MTITLRYFAWIRERIGKSEETLDVPAEIASVADLVAWLKTQGPEYAAAFERAEVIRAAIDHTHVQRDARLVGAREVAFFPPVTGG